MASSVQAEFQQAQQDVRTLPTQPSNDVLLKLYALYKQATQGDATGERPGGFNFVGAAKYDAWKALNGQSSETAQQEYVALVQQLRGR
ncbi:MAG: acyl-CoA-binding protein [Deinococcus sp.]|nr:acyl-CoA-binding protein [Deinococcus sp.]